MAFVHGKQTVFKYGGSIFQVNTVDWDHKIEDEDITHSGANGFQVLIAGIESAGSTIEFIYDTANKPTVSPFNFRPGTVGALIVDPDGSDPHTFSGLCVGFKWKGGPKAGALKCSVEFKSSGAVAVPTS